MWWSWTKSSNAVLNRPIKSLICLNLVAEMMSKKNMTMAVVWERASEVAWHTTEYGAHVMSVSHLTIAEKSATAKGMMYLCMEGWG